MALVFWISVALIAYVYVGYPAMLYCRSRMNRTVHESTIQSAIRNPQSAIGGGVSIVIAARNEGSRLARRLDNLLSLSFPSSQRQIIVVSDGSSDNTLEVLARYRGFVDVIPVPAGGKALALNAGVAHARFDIVVFADARQVFAHDALRQLVAPFADRRVGAVTGELRLDAESPCRRSGHDRRHVRRRAAWREAVYDRRGQERRKVSLRSTIADGVGLYWKYEKQLRRLESGIDSTLGATGAIYAVRRSLFRPLPADTILDDVLTPMRVVLAGYRVVFNEKALRIRSRGGQRRRRGAPQGSDARGQLPDSRARARVAPAVAQSRVAAVRVAQARAADRALRDAGDLRGQHGAGRPGLLRRASSHVRCSSSCWPAPARSSSSWTSAVRHRRRCRRHRRPPGRRRFGRARDGPSCGEGRPHRLHVRDDELRRRRRPVRRCARQASLEVGHEAWNA